MLPLTCKRATALLSAALERRPSPHERLLLRLHLLGCAACLRFQRQLVMLRRLIRQRARQL